MRRKKISLIIAVAIITSVSSCTKKGPTGPEGPAGPTGPAGPSYTGTINGHVTLYDQYGSKMTTDLTSVQLQLNGGTAINPDNTGYYIFANVTTGVYYILASNTGYATTNGTKFQYLADTLNRDIKLSIIPNFSPTSVSSYTAIAAPGDSIIVNFNPDARARNCILFVNSNSVVGNVPPNYLLVYIRTIPANQAKSTVVIPASDLYDVGITSGSVIYCAAYGYVIGDVSVYEDITTGKNVYNAISTGVVTTTAVTP